MRMQWRGIVVGALCVGALLLTTCGDDSPVYDQGQQQNRMAGSGAAVAPSGTEVATEYPGWPRDTPDGGEAVASAGGQGGGAGGAGGEGGAGGAGGDYGLMP